NIKNGKLELIYIIEDNSNEANDTTNFSNNNKSSNQDVQLENNKIFIDLQNDANLSWIWDIH
ncbi:3465_t:CDS:1, partial [Dentiscutata heterogama]